ncbi:nucleolin [Phlebotomus papatasi]|uniref:nucleolin n=1 Tax=Phlebotomus papatasi TaxID=29031 RepID=UPI002483468B|nr:nucleolin [Phlebotomus papatasi]
MRNRTELKTTTIEGSDYEEEVSDADDSEEDWQPEKDGDAAAAAGKKKVGKVAPQKKATPGKRKAPAAKAGKATKGKKAKKESSDDDDGDDDDDIEDESDEEFPSDSEESEEEVKNGDGTKKKRPAKKEGADPNGVFTLYVKKMDLKNGLNEQQNLFMWKRDGSSLLQRFKQNKTDPNEYVFTPTTVYSCWEDRRKDEYFEVKTKSASGGDGLVTIVDKEEFAKFIEQSKTYEKPESEDENEEEGEGGDNSEDEEEGEEDNSDEEES